MNAISFLIKEHGKIRRTLEKITIGTKRLATKQRLFDAVCHDLILHERMEHKLWYPHFKNNKKVKLIVKHLLSEEKETEKKIKKLSKVKTNEEWEELFEELAESMDHHANEEEEELFPKVKEILDDDALKEIGKDFREYKQEHEYELF